MYTWTNLYINGEPKSKDESMDMGKSLMALHKNVLTSIENVRQRLNEVDE